MVVCLQIEAVRKATREEKKRKAMALRKKELGALGMHVGLSMYDTCGPRKRKCRSNQLFIGYTANEFSFLKNIKVLLDMLVLRTAVSSNSGFSIVWMCTSKDSK